jgi:hypothetical protein
MTMTTFKHWCPDCTGHQDWRQRDSMPDEVMCEGTHMFFENGYGISIQRNSATYSTHETFEVAVLHRSREMAANDDWRLCYCTRVTDDVMGYQTGDDVARTIAALVALPQNDYCTHMRKDWWS